MKENKYLRAEKALLSILKIDEHNAAAFNRLGILYAKQKNFTDAIDCFEIAVSLERSASSLHNLGLIYYEVGDYKKSKKAFEKALAEEDNLAARHIAYAKVLEKLGIVDDALEHLRTAYILEPNKETMHILYSAYEFYGKTKRAQDLLKTYSKDHPGDASLAALVYGVRQLAEVAEQENNAVDRVIARHNL